MTGRMCGCGVRELREDEAVCPACAEAASARWKQAVVAVLATVGTTLATVVLSIVTKGGAKPKA